MSDGWEEVGKASLHLIQDPGGVFLIMGFMAMIAGAIYFWMNK